MLVDILYSIVVGIPATIIPYGYQAMAYLIFIIINAAVVAILTTTPLMYAIHLVTKALNLGQENI